ncbi:tripartite tricarboxylate transporter substrate binding protein [Verminephrobacter aporrectodeae subsp. tuberculatae]|uniref:Bug family tripartite tricarboxylate transporter substrate binding protein n=1 Tax=Verminephrobacter aporrectodeae TaxID=1110389 RepID=UPI0022442C92|nr:tripartite tricarboxylate transporter substrate binding protein [Verminephrobacter aporrectodeae]MCW8208287.1 tripartite tricarboxylate transporter substrate binding protein [Verminephrobacter aporrectodeae subsp. tuberculatae]
MMIRRHLLRATCVCLANLVAVSSARAEAVAWPARPVKLIVPFGAGSGNDIVARLLADRLSRALGQPFVVHNQVGANGAIGAEAAAHAAPDGYTLFLATNTTQAANPGLMKKLRYDPVKEFAPISRVANTPALLVVHPSVQARTVPELIALAKSRPGQLSYASGSAGTRVPGAMLTSAAGLDMLHVPYKTIPQALADVVAGQVHGMFTDMATGIQQVRAGKVRAIGISSLRPTPLLPEVQPIALTLPGFELLAWYALYAPAGTPQPVIARLNAETRTALSDAALRERLVSLGLEPISSTPQELAAFGHSELEKWTRLIREVGIEPE